MDASIDYGAITTVAYFSVQAAPNGSLVRGTIEWSRWMGSAMTRVIERAHANGVRVVLTVDRFAWSDADRAETEALLRDPSARQRLTREITAAVQSRGVDGVSLDFEPIPGTVREEFELFVHELRAAFDAVDPRYQITFATTSWLSTATHRTVADLTRSGAADAVVIMGYPMRSWRASRVGGIAPVESSVYDLTDTLDAYLVRTPSEAIILALPWYGRDWPAVTDELNGPSQSEWGIYGAPRAIYTRAALHIAARNGRRYDPVEHSAWTAYRARACPGCPETWRQVYYEDVDSLGYKYDLATSRGLRGIGIWALGYDAAEPVFWTLLRTRYRGLVDTQAPSGRIGPMDGTAETDSERVQLAVESSDGPDGTGVVFVRVSNDPGVTGGVLTAGRTYPSTTTLDWALDDVTVGGTDAAGPRTVYAQWRDVSGNWSEVTSTELVLAPPPMANVTIAAGATVTDSATVSVVVTHVSGRSIAGIRLSNSPTTSNGVLAGALEVPYGAPVDFSLIDAATGGTDADGEHTVYVQWRDAAGRWWDVTSRTIVLDRLAPSGSLAIVGSPAYVTSRAIQLSAVGTDTTTAVSMLGLSNDGVAWTDLSPSDGAIDWTLEGLDDGLRSIHARWRDAAGNWSSPVSTSVVLDTQGPNGSVVLDGGAPATNADSVLVTNDAFDATSAVAEMLLSNSDATVDGVLADASSFGPATAEPWPLATSGTQPGAAEGIATVYAQWRDGAGNWSSVMSATIVVDRTAPVVPEPSVALRSMGQLDDAAVPVVVTWNASDPGSGLAGVRLESSIDGNVWSTLATSVGSVEDTLDVSTARIYRVTATDRAGNDTTVMTAPITARLSQESAKALRYAGAWTTATIESASGGATRYSRTRSDTVEMTFWGRSIALIAPEGPKRGMARVFIDGVAAATIDLHDALPSARRMVFSQGWAASGQHTIRVRVLGTAGRPRVDVDAFLVIP